MSPKRVNERQLALLQRVADGVEPVNSREYGLATTVFALRNRGLVTRRESGIWTAAITEAGRYYLAHGRYRVESAAADRPKATVAEHPERPTISGEDLIEQLEAAGGSLRIADPETAARGAWRRAIHAAANGGGLPAGMRLWHTGRDRGDLVVRLVPRRAVQATTRHEAPVIPVADRLVRPHPVVAKIKELSTHRLELGSFDRTPVSGPHPQLGLEVSRRNLGRALRILQALVTEAEHRGHEVRLDKAANDPRVSIVVKGHECAVSVREKDDLLRVVLPSVYSGRRLWSDGVRAAAEDKLGDVLANIEGRAEEAEERRLERERREEDRRRAWEHAMELARERSLEDDRAALLRDQVAAWRLAADIRSFCSTARDSAISGAGDSRQAEAWLAWATNYADAIDPLSRTLAVPESREPTPDELRPYLRGWNPYGPA